MDQKKGVKKFTFGLPTRKPTTSTNTTNDQPSAVSSSSGLTTTTLKRQSNLDGQLSSTPTTETKRKRTIEADDEDDFLISAGLAPTKVNNQSETTTNLDEDDPLDAFMADMTEQAKKSIPEQKARRDDLEEEDDIETYVRHMKDKGIVIGKTGRSTQRDENADSDEEVYATAAAVDAQLRYDSDDMDNNNVDGRGKKEIEPLARVDHDSIQYPEIEKYFYQEHPDITAMTMEQTQKIRKDIGIYVSGSQVAKPCISFAHFGFDEDLMAAIIKAGYTEPSGIQKQAIPVALEGRDIIGIAKTGSGKTAAFVLPMLVHIMDQEELVKGDGPIGLILAPTRELAVQIYSETKKFAKGYGLKVAAVYGGASKMQQFKDLRSGTVEILVATPGRLIDMIKMKATNLRRVSYLCLDEADRMFDLGFEPQVRSICDNVRPDRQTLLFSATFQKKVENLARQVTTDPVRISVGQSGQANEDITQEVVVLEDELLKWDWLMQYLPSLCIDGSVIIFVSRKGAVDLLANNIKEAGYSVGALHGDLMQVEREKVLRDFKSNKLTVLVATDVAARGLDIKAVKTVINYDIARDIDSHTHRVGRTGRAGEKGKAITLITKKEDRFAGELVNHLEGSNQLIPKALMDLALSNPKFRHRHSYRGGYGRGRGRGGRGRGRGLGFRKGKDATGANREALSSGSRYSSIANPIQFQRPSSSASSLHTVQQGEKQFQ
ncbi:P-loop containing nucleoside triphosphate hydrolase protein [Halteromyces radiatus]|uniref:P-loop containing nucleoside triphosphate hydrolase protein n=1 Tax=Halteromyces radiatus TaxID=101107 RepID=UPI00222038DC|nr:P-loop containing nucleoside triphosphate hydrolase protein [Halteromyces radiatus]KAI8092934.1 P-loop containing nucleoside triphosphate hydrolase protein [Halteromyces radiatus]